MYIPREIWWFIFGFISCVVISGIFTYIVDKDDIQDINIDQDIKTFKARIKKYLKKTFNKNDVKIKPSKIKTKKKMTKKEIKKKLNKMFKD